MTIYSNGKLAEIENSETLTVVGDLHGDLESFNKILKNWNEKKNNYIIFLGDYADRGENGLEIIEKLEELKDKENVVLLKGNHEDYDENGNPLFSPCTLISEVAHKRGYWNSFFSKNLKPFFNNLHIAAIAEKNMLFLHGGISSKIRSLDDLRHPSREVEMDIIWSDPNPFEKGEHPNMRGEGLIEFGEDVTEKVLKDLNASLIVRSHQPNLAASGPYSVHKDKVVTISSTSIYGGKPHYLEIPSLKIGEIVRSPIEIKKYAKIL